jgi:hypothetical protein
MAVVPLMFREDYWKEIVIQGEDIEFLYNHLLELETPQTSQELVKALVYERIRREKQSIEQQRSSGGALYFPKDDHTIGQKLIFPALEWQQGEVIAVRPGKNPDLPPFSVIRVEFGGGVVHEYASNIEDHILNEPPEVIQETPDLDPEHVLATYGEALTAGLENQLKQNADFVRIAFRWFPVALLVNINAGHLNLAEAVLDMAGGGPMTTAELMKSLELPSNINSKLVEFSLDLALEEDERFDEVGPAGEILWFLRRLEPAEVLHPPVMLRYHPLEHDRTQLTSAMQTLERDLHDELSPADSRPGTGDEVQIRLIYPHWRAGTLPLANQVRHLFPTAYEAPRIRFSLVDYTTGQKFPAWVVRQNGYVVGLRAWYESKGLMPGSLVTVKRGKKPGEVIVHAEVRRPIKEYIRTLLIGSDGGTVFAMLKQNLASNVDERMAIAIPDLDALDQAWQQAAKDRTPFEQLVVHIVRELSKLNPQSHVHASELYAAVNAVRRCPPGPILALLASRPWFKHVGDLHFRFDDSEK